MGAGIAHNRRGRTMLIRDSRESDMTRIERAASQRCTLQTAESRSRPVTVVELIATISLALSTLVAATAVSLGIARAEVFNLRADGDSPLAIALLIGLLLLVMGGLSALTAEDPNGKA
jgi:hypothetical protein